MKQTVLGSTGLRVTPLVFGSLPLGPLQADLDPREGGRLIRHALDCGINMVDTAELYGTYEHLREGLAGLSDLPIIASKTHATRAEDARQHVGNALQGIGVERLDIVHIHGARLSDPFNERAEVLDELLQMRDEGLIGHIGLSTHYICAVRAAADHPEIEVVHPLINRGGMGILDGSAEEMAAAISYAADRGKGIYAMKALAGGNLISSARASLGYVRELDGVHAVAVGMLAREEIEANIAMFDQQAEDETLWRALESRRRHLKIMANFCKGCGACVDACTNDALRVVDGKAEVIEENCILCGYCAAACPEFIIRVV